MASSLIIGDCTSISFNKSELGYSSPLSSDVTVENETVLSTNSSISINHILGSKTFVERVRSATTAKELSILFPRGSLTNKKIKKRPKKKSNDSQESSEESSKSQVEPNCQHDFTLEPSSQESTSAPLKPSYSESQECPLYSENSSTTSLRGKTRNCMVQNVSVNFDTSSESCDKSHNKDGENSFGGNETKDKKSHQRNYKVDFTLGPSSQESVSTLLKSSYSESQEQECPSSSGNTNTSSRRGRKRNRLVQSVSINDTNSLCDKSLSNKDGDDFFDENKTHKKSIGRQTKKSTSKKVSDNLECESETSSAYEPAESNNKNDRKSLLIGKKRKYKKDTDDVDTNCLNGSVNFGQNSKSESVESKTTENIMNNSKNKCSKSENQDKNEIITIDQNNSSKIVSTEFCSADSEVQNLRRSGRIKSNNRSRRGSVIFGLDAPLPSVSDNTVQPTKEDNESATEEMDTSMEILEKVNKDSFPDPKLSDCNKADLNKSDSHLEGNQVLTVGSNCLNSEDGMVPEQPKTTITNKIESVLLNPITRENCDQTQNDNFGITVSAENNQGNSLKNVSKNTNNEFDKPFSSDKNECHSTYITFTDITVPNTNSTEVETNVKANREVSVHFDGESLHSITSSLLIDKKKEKNEASKIVEDRNEKHVQDPSVINEEYQTNNSASHNISNNMKPISEETFLISKDESVISRPLINISKSGTIGCKNIKEGVSSKKHVSVHFDWDTSTFAEASKMVATNDSLNSKQEISDCKQNTTFSDNTIPSTKSTRVGTNLKAKREVSVHFDGETLHSTISSSMLDKKDERNVASEILENRIEKPMQVPPLTNEEIKNSASHNILSDTKPLSKSKDTLISKDESTQPLIDVSKSETIDTNSACKNIKEGVSLKKHVSVHFDFDSSSTVEEPNKLVDANELLNSKEEMGDCGMNTTYVVSKKSEIHDTTTSLPEKNVEIDVNKGSSPENVKFVKSGCESQIVINNCTSNSIHPKVDSGSVELNDKVHESSKDSQFKIDINDSAIADNVKEQNMLSADHQFNVQEYSEEKVCQSTISEIPNENKSNSGVGIEILSNNVQVESNREGQENNSNLVKKSLPKSSVEYLPILEHVTSNQEQPKTCLTDCTDAQVREQSFKENMGHYCVKRSSSTEDTVQIAKDPGNLFSDTEDHKSDVNDLRCASQEVERMSLNTAPISQHEVSKDILDHETDKRFSVHLPSLVTSDILEKDIEEQKLPSVVEPELHINDFLPNSTKDGKHSSNNLPQLESDSSELDYPEKCEPNLKPVTELKYDSIEQNALDNCCTERGKDSERKAPVSSSTQAAQQPHTSNENNSTKMKTLTNNDVVDNTSSIASKENNSIVVENSESSTNLLLSKNCSVNSVSQNKTPKKRSATSPLTISEDISNLKTKDQQTDSCLEIQPVEGDKENNQAPNRIDINVSENMENNNTISPITLNEAGKNCHQCPPVKSSDELTNNGKSLEIADENQEICKTTSNTKMQNKNEIVSSPTSLIVKQSSSSTCEAPLNKLSNSPSSSEGKCENSAQNHSETPKESLENSLQLNGSLKKNVNSKSPVRNQTPKPKSPKKCYQLRKSVACSPQIIEKQNVTRGKRKSVTFASTARLKSDSCSGEIALNTSPTMRTKICSISNNMSGVSNTGISEFEMSMSVGLSVIPREDQALQGRQNCHSTPKKNNVGKNERICSSPTDKESQSDHVFACPQIPHQKSRDSKGENVSYKKRSHNEAEENISSNKNEKSSDSLKRRKTVDKTINELSYDTFLDVSEIPLDKTIHQKRLIYHSTPINPVLERKKTDNILSKKEQVSSKNQKEKMIQVSKSVFGTSSEITSGISGKKSSELSTSYSYGGKLTRSKRKSISPVSLNNQKDKMVQVSKTIFGTSSEITAGISEKKSSGELSTSYSYGGKVTRLKRKSTSPSASSKKAKQSDASSDNSSKQNVRSESTFSESSRKSTSFSEEESSNGNKASNEESSSIRVFHSGNMLSTLSQSSKETLYSDVEYKKVQFRNFSSHIESDLSSCKDNSLPKANNYSPGSFTGSDFISQNSSPCISQASDRTCRNTRYSIQRSMSRSRSINTTSTMPGSKTGRNIPNISSSIMNEFTLSTPELLSLEKKIKKDQNMIKEKKKSQPYPLAQKVKNVKSVLENDVRFMIGNKPYVPPNFKHDSWVSSELIQFCTRKLKSSFDLESSVIAEDVVLHISSTVYAVRILNNEKLVEPYILLLKNILKKYDICLNMLEYVSFIMKFTPFDFQRKVLPLGGYFGSFKRDSDLSVKISDPLISESNII